MEGGVGEGAGAREPGGDAQSKPMVARAILSSDANAKRRQAGVELEREPTAPAFSPCRGPVHQINGKLAS